MSNSLTLIERNEKRETAAIHSGGIIMREKKRKERTQRNLLASLFLSSSCAGEREIEKS
jgi:hypothetical protein